MCLAASLTAQLTTENIVTTPKMMIREKETKLRTSKAMKLPLSHFACFFARLASFWDCFSAWRDCSQFCVQSSLSALKLPFSMS